MLFYEPKRDVEQLISCCEYKNVKALSHFHRSIELIYVLCGRVDAVVGERCASAKKDEIIFIPSGYNHSVESIDGTRSITLIVPYCYFAPFEKRDIALNFLELNIKKKNRLILSHVLSIKERINCQSTLLMQGFVNVILGLIIESYASQSADYKRNDLILDIVNYVEQNYTENITLEKISSHFGYSKYYFSKLFNKLFNCTLKSYINTVRYNSIDESRAESVSSAVLDAGFNSLSSYYKFKAKQNIALKALEKF